MIGRCPFDWVKTEQPFLRRLLGCQTGDAVDGFNLAFTADNMEPFTGEPEYLSTVMEVEVSVEGG